MHRRFPLALSAVLSVAGWASVAAQTESRETEAPPAAAPAPQSQSAPASAAQVFRLVQVASQALPVEIEKGWRCREDVTSGTLTLGADGRWQLQTVQRETCGDQTREELESDDGRYTADGQSFRFFDEDGEPHDKDVDLIGKDIDLDDMTRGSLTGDGTLTVQLADEKTTLVFRR